VAVTQVRSHLFRSKSLVSIPEGCQRVIDPAEPLAPHLIEPPFQVGVPCGSKL
jgi:hypothetical protein